MKTNMKRLLAMLLCLVMLMGVLPTTALAAQSNALPELANGTALAALPEEVSGIHHKHIYDYGVEDFTVMDQYDHIAVKEDFFFVSPLRQAVAIDCSKVTANHNFFKISEDKPMTVINTGSADMTGLYAKDFILDGKYHFYRLSGVNTGSALRFFDGSLQLKFTDMPELIADVYFSMRIDGELSYVSAANSPTYYIDRILVVTDCAGYITADDYIPDEEFTCAEEITGTAACPQCEEEDTITLEGSQLPHTPEYDANFGFYTGKCKVCGAEIEIDEEYGNYPDEMVAELKAGNTGVEHVIGEIHAKDFVVMDQYAYISRVKDPDSAIKQAVAIDYSKVESNHAFFQITDTKALTVMNTGSKNLRSVFAPEIKGFDSYHIYMLSGINVQNAVRFFDGSLQADLPALELDIPNKIVDIFLSMKIEGALDYTDEDNYPIYYIDRIWVVDACEDHIKDYDRLVEEATCTTQAIWEGECLLCGAVHAKKQGELRPHSEEVVPAVEATCTAPGLTEGKKCADCGKVLAAQKEVPQLDHIYGAPYVKVKGGKYYQNCTVCENAEKEYTRFCAELPVSVIDALGNGDWEKHIYDYNIDDMQAPAAKKIADETAMDGKAICYNVSEYSEVEQNLYFHFGKGDPMPITAVGGKVIASIQAEDLIYDGKYHVYEITDVKLPANFSGLYLFDTTLQNHFTDLTDLGGKTVNLYISMKIVEERNVPKYYYVDRMILVDLCKYFVDSYTSDRNATCLKDGTETGVCTKCGKTYTRVEEETMLPHKAEGIYFYNPATEHYEAPCANGCGGRAYIDFGGRLPANMLKDLIEGEVGLEHVYQFQAEDKDVFDAMTQISYVNQENGAVRFNYTDATADSKAYFDNKIITNAGKVLEVADFVADGEYHVYKLSNVNISDDIVFFDETLSVRFPSLSLWGNKQVDVYFSMKVEVEEKTYYYIDQIYVIGSCTHEDGCHLCEDFLYAPEYISTNVDSYGDLVDSADGRTVTLKVTGNVPMLTSSESPVGRVGYWVGFVVTAPEGMDASLVTVRNPEGTVYKLFDVKDGENPVYANFYKNVEEKGKYAYEIDWEGDGSYDLTVVIDATEAILGENYAAARIGSSMYETLEDAYNAAAKAGETITLLSDTNGDGIIIDKNVTIDLDGYTYTINGTLVGSTGTQSCGFQILKDNTVTIKNGAIVVDETAVRGHDGKVGNNFVIQNYANLTLEDVSVTGNSNTSYVVSINSGKVAMTGNTSITAQEGNVAFDVCKYLTYAAPVVTVDTTGTIKGIVEVSGGALAIDAAVIEGALVCTSGSVTKAEAVDLEAPEGYEWNDAGLLVEIVEEPVVELKKFAGANVDLGNALDMNFAISTNGIAETGYAVIERERDGVAQTPVNVPLRSCKANNFYIIPYKGIAAKEMTDMLYVTIYDAEGNQVSEKYADSIRNYVMRTLDKSENPETLQTLLVDILNYGAAAQDYFNYKEDVLANARLTEEQKALSTTEMAECKNYREEGPWKAFLGTSLSLESRIEYSIAVKTSEVGANGKVVVSYTDHMGTMQNVTLERGEGNSAYVLFKLASPVVADGRCKMSVKIYGDNGDLIETVTESMESYIARMSTDSQYSWMTSIMVFSDSAYAYLHRNDVQ